jgi:hypothetical protein
MDFFKNGLALIWATLIADTWNESEKCTSSVQGKNNGVMANRKNLGLKFEEIWFEALTGFCRLWRKTF